MSLNKKAFILISLTIGVAILAIIAASRIILVGGYEDLEKKTAQRNTERALSGLDEIIYSIDNLNSDWANWDDAYKFVNDLNENFIDVNLTDTTFTNVKINAFIFTDIEGNIIYAKEFDLKENREIPVSNVLKSHIKREDLLLTHTGRDHVSGLISTASGPMIISSHPILTSEGGGPARGNLIMAKYVDEEVIQRLNNITRFDFSFVPYEESPFAKNDLNNKQEVFVELVSRDRLFAYMPISDIYGNPSFVGRVDMSREISSQARTIINYFVLATVLIGSIMIAGGIFYQDRFILSPIHNLMRGVDSIRQKEDITQRVEVEGQDEISLLANNINSMLASLQDMETKTKESEGELEEKYEIIKKQNDDLQKTKKAMLNVMEDQKQLEETLRKEHDRLDLIISSMGEGLLVIDNKHKLTAINPTAQKLLEVKAEEVVGRNWSDLAITMKDHSETPIQERSFAKAISDGKTIVTSLEDDHSYKTKTGKIFPIVSITAPLKTHDGKIIGAVKVFRDATKEKKSRSLIEKEVKDRTRLLWEERARMISSIESIQMGFIVADKKDQIVIKNPAVTEMLKIDEKDISIDRLSAELLANLNLKEVIALCQTNRKNFEKDNIYYKDKFLRIFITPVTLEENKEVIGYVLLIEDVTEEKQLARAKDEFFAVASHELRTPLTAIRGNTSLIMDYFIEKIQDQDLKEMIADMHESSVRLINIVNDFLDASRLEQGKVELKNEEFNLVEVAEGIVGELDEFSKQNGLSINIEKSEDTIMINSDKSRVQQIGHNLVGNAIKFTKQGGITVRLSRNDTSAKFSVTDSGVGISPANQRLLFKKFQQAGERVLARDVTKGTGMGLYISKLLAEALGGKVYLESSELGKGSTFAFELPLAIQK